MLHLTLAIFMTRIDNSVLFTHFLTVKLSVSVLSYYYFLSKILSQQIFCSNRTDLSLKMN